MTGREMYERSYGYRYKELEDTSAAGIAKAVRADIKVAQSEGLLPTRWNYSVRCDNFPGGCSVNVTVRDCPDAWEVCDGGSKCRDPWCKAGGIHRDLPAATEHEVLTDEAEAAKLTLGRIHGAYNHDGSEIQMDYHDVRYYGQVTFETARDTRWRREWAAEAAERKAATDAGEVLGRVVNYKRDGSSVTHTLVRLANGKERLACGAAARFGLMKAADDAELTCSRCAKKAP